jgi:CheY-specific phosphatase CheX
MATLSLQSQIHQIDAFIVESTKDVCSTMLGWEVTESPVQTSENNGNFTLNTVNGSIGFAGGLTGSIFFCADDALAQRMARVIIGGEQAPSSQDVSDVVAELTNMLAGGCKSRLCDHKCPVVMSIPNIIRGRVIRASSRGIRFVHKRDFAISGTGEVFQVIVLGKFD